LSTIDLRLFRNAADDALGQFSLFALKRAVRVINDTPSFPKFGRR